jgi:hypothetical protein
MLQLLWLFSLTDTMRRLLGIRPDVARQIDRSQLYLAGGFSMRVAAAIVAAGLLYFGWLYLRDGKRPSLWVKAPLLLLRLIALAALLAILLQPMLRLTHVKRQKAIVAVLVDTSQSMALTDPKLPQARADVAASAAGISSAEARTLTRAQLLERIANSSRVELLRTLQKRFQIRLYNFDSTAKPVESPSNQSSPRSDGTRLLASPDMSRGGSTQVGVGIRRALDDVAGQPVAGALVLSDGGNNLGEDPVTVADRARQQGMPVSTFGVGDPTPTRDVAVTEVLADQVARKDATVQIFAGLAHRGYEGRPVTVTLRRGGETIGTKSLALGPAARKETVSFTHVPKQVGTFTYSVSVSEQPGEITRENNRRQFLQRVVGKRLKILYVEGEPRWEYRYLKNAIMRDTQIRFGCILVSSTAQTGGEGNIPVFRFPPDEKALFEYDLIILGDVPRSYFNELQLRNMRRFVEDRGGSLLVVSGEKHMPHEYRGTLLEQVFPVVMAPYQEQIHTDAPFKWELTTEGRQDPLLRMAESSAESARIWQEMPGMLWQAGVERAKPGATVLAVNSSRSNSYGKRVILAVQSFGAGRCLFSTADSTWRWRWRVGDRYFYRYWGQAIRSLTPHETPGGNRFAQVNADRPEYLLGDRVSLHARLLDSFYRPIKDRRVVGTLKPEHGSPVQLTLNAVPGSPGLFSADILAERVGKYQLSLASPASPGQSANATFLVQSVALEKQQPEMNEELLKRIARAGGGSYLQAGELRAWAEKLPAKDLVVTSESEVELWDSPLLLTLFVVPLALEWLIRKRTGML